MPGSMTYVYRLWAMDLQTPERVAKVTLVQVSLVGLSPEAHWAYT